MAKAKKSYEFPTKLAKQIPQAVHVAAKRPLPWVWMFNARTRRWTWGRIYY